MHSHMTKEAADALVKWYHVHARILPWREDPSPYKVWVSEIMLQQTRVEAVKPYFQRFISVLPDVKSLAECPEDQLLKLWEGLGYYSRVRNMQKAARMIVNELGGHFPSSFKELLRLPGIGSYTAGAIASIAMHLPEPAVDGNVLRVMSRLNMDDQNILEQSAKNKTYDLLRDVIPKNEPGAFNQAMMDLGAMICVANTIPDCENCPLQKYCLAFKNKITQQFPVRIKKQIRTQEKRTVLVIRDGFRTVLHKRPEKGLLAGMYEFPCIEDHSQQDEVVAYAKSLGISPMQIVSITDAKHIFTHREWHMKGYMILAEDLENARLAPGYMAVDVKETEAAYAIPSAFKAYSAYLSIKIGNEKLINSSERMVSI